MMNTSDRFNFETALHLMKDGQAVARDGWNGTGLSTRLQRPTDTSKMTKPYFFITAVNQSSFDDEATLVPWIPSQTDLLGEDWYLITQNI